jgi:hypothetical protein
MKWCALQEDVGYMAHPCLPASMPESRSSSCSEPPIRQVEIMGQLRDCNGWTFVKGADTDDKGWQYCFDFYVSGSYWGSQCQPNCHVRRRQWRPSQLSLAAPVDLKASAPTTFLEEKNLGEALEPIMEAEVGGIPLYALAAEFDRDDWNAPGRLMASFWANQGAKDFEIGAWTTRAVGGVKGKVRSVEIAHMPVPPAPLCPEETRVEMTYHFYQDDGQVVLEYVCMSLDVPYGTNFNVVVCDTFVSEEGRTRMTRHVAIEWLQSVFMKNVVEANVPKNCAANGRLFAETIVQWVPKELA